VKANAKGYPEVQSCQGANTSDNRNNIFVQVFGTTSADVSESMELKSTPISRVVKPPAVSTFDLPGSAEPRTAGAVVDPEEAPVSVPATTDTTDRTAPIELEEFDANPRLKRFRAKRADNLELTIDVAFLKHLIHVLIENHSISISPKDTQCIMSFFDTDCEVRIKKRKIIERSAGEPTCCGTTEYEREVIVDTIHKIIVGGLNVLKTAPQFISFLAELGVSF
jgi:hypothetical protein